MKNPLYRKYRQSLLPLLIHLQRCKDQQGGYTIAITAAMLLILVSLVVTATILGNVDDANTNSSSRSSQGFFAAEAGLNLRAKEIRDRFQGFNRPSGTSPNDTDGDGELWDSCVSGSSLGTGDFDCDNSLDLQGQDVTTYVEDVTGATPTSMKIPANEQPFGGLNAQEYRYDVFSVARDAQNLPTAILGMRFKSQLIPLFQFMAFYEEDLDFTYPPSMALNGPIHSNNDIYLNASGTMQIYGPVTTGGTLYRGMKVENLCSGTVEIDADANASNGNSPILSCGGSLRKNYAQSELGPWNDKVSVGVQALDVPKPDEFDPTPGKLYWDSADLRIVLKLDSTGNPIGIEVRNQDNSLSSTTTDLLSCTAIDSAGTPISTALQGEGTGDTEYESNDVRINVANGAAFQKGDLIVIGDDYDSNVVDPNRVNNPDTGSTPDVLYLSRQLRHGYQSPTVASTSASVRKAVVSTSDTFYNYREKNGGSGPDAGRYIRMLNIDVQQLLNCAHSSNLMAKALDDDTDGGLVWFLTIEGGPTTTVGSPSTAVQLAKTDVQEGGDPNPYGIRLYNGSELTASSALSAPPIKGLTVISDQAVYIQGDYNSINKKPAAVLADTINVLSNNWKLDDSNSRGYSANFPDTTVSLTDGSRDAINTTINAAFLAGVEVSGGVSQGGQDQGYSSSFSGGLHNYPRLHEDWSGYTLVYRGSMVSLNQPRRVNGPFCGSGSTDPNCNIYNAPTRDWDFDLSFKDASGLPPLTPRAVYLKQELFQRNFDRVNHPEQPIQHALALQQNFVF